MVYGIPALIGAVLVSVGLVIGVRAVRRMRHQHRESGAALLALSVRRDDLVGVLRASLELSPDQPAIINDLQEHRIIVANRAFHQATGYAPGDLNGRPYLPLIHPDDLARTDAASDTVPLIDPSARFVNRYRTGSGGWVRLEWRAGHYADARGYGLSLADVKADDDG